ncbi:MAG: carbon starvation protein A [Treponema sp.]|jgi:carbon starvation protein|nr:carbon starvation protein A [Treponema sp.]
MNGLILLIIAAAVLFVGYLLYGRWLAWKWGVDPNKETPAHEFEDGVDYVPTRPGVVFGHEFASIAGAGPINGPIIAAMFGWVPVLLWILIGGVFIGAVQDFSALYASVKNKGKTIGYIIESYIGKTGKRLFLLFVWLFSILVVAAFADIVRGTFAGFDAEGARITANASVATTSMLFIAGAVALGFFIRKARPGEIACAGVAVALLVVCITLGLLFPLYLSGTVWLYIVFAYIFFASITPVWALLQPRDYLNSFLLVFVMGGAFLGVIFSAPAVTIPAFTGFNVNENYLFPVLFVIVTCGAVSGFHALVASGTASKQLDNELHILPISFGAMLMECLLAVLSLIAVGSLAVGGKLPTGTPPMIFATAVSGFLVYMGLPENATYTIITLAISAFALTSLDSVARAGRLAFQELFTEDLVAGREPSRVVTLLSNKYVATLFTLFLGYLLAILGYQNVWPLFGSANQLLAALTLIACAVFLKKTKRQGSMLYVPMFFMLAVTFAALVVTIVQKGGKLFSGGFTLGSDGLQLAFAVLLLALGVMVAVSGVQKLSEKDESEAARAVVR